MRETGELASTSRWTSALGPELLAPFLPFILNWALQLTGVGDCGYRKSEVCQQMVLRRRPGPSPAHPPGLTPSVLFLQGNEQTPDPGSAVLSAGEAVPPHNVPTGLAALTSL